MPELFLELFSEEIPARMQMGAAATLERLIGDGLHALKPTLVETYHGPRRIALKAELDASVPATIATERGPRASAPPQALDGFLRKHGATRDQLTDENGHWVLTRATPATPAATLVAPNPPRPPPPLSLAQIDALGTRLRLHLGAPASAASSACSTARSCPSPSPTTRMTATTSPPATRPRAIASTPPGPFRVDGRAAWEQGLLARHVIPAAAERRTRIATGLAALAAAEHLAIVPDDGLLDEVAGLVEWPVPLLGRIDDAFMDLPPEVMQVSMRVNQRYFALRTADGRPARASPSPPTSRRRTARRHRRRNERVLRARFSDARHFWDLDRRTPLADRVAALETITFHAKLGTQAARVQRIEALARHLAPLVGAEPDLAARAARLAKADLTTGMVGEFPELQGTMGAYYAAHDGEPPAVAQAIRDHYAPRGPQDPAPSAPVSIAVALADKIDQLAAFFSVGEVPTGSGDPFALRRAALGVIRLVRENRLPPAPRIRVRGGRPRPPGPRAHPCLARLHRRPPPHPAPRRGRPPRRAHRRLRSRRRRRPRPPARPHRGRRRLPRHRGRPRPPRRRPPRRQHPPHRGQEGRPPTTPRSTPPSSATRPSTPGRHPRHRRSGDPGRPRRRALHRSHARPGATPPTLDAFFADVTVNDPDPALRRNRLNLLAQVGAAMSLAADFSKIEGQST